MAQVHWIVFGVFWISRGVIVTIGCLFIAFYFFPSIELLYYNTRITSDLKTKEYCGIACQVKRSCLFILASTVYCAFIS